MQAKHVRKFENLTLALVCNHSLPQSLLYQFTMDETYKSLQEKVAPLQAHYDRVQSNTCYYKYPLLQELNALKERMISAWHREEAERVFNEALLKRRAAASDAGDVAHLAHPAVGNEFPHVQAVQPGEIYVSSELEKQVCANSQDIRKLFQNQLKMCTALGQVMNVQGTQSEEY